jgi:hypothetical protein
MSDVRRRAAFCFAAVLVAGCASAPVARPATGPLTADDTELELKVNRFISAAMVRQLMSHRGLALLHRVSTQDRRSECLVFSGLLSDESENPLVAPWFAVRVDPAGDGSRIRVLGRATSSHAGACVDLNAAYAAADVLCENAAPERPRAQVMLERREDATAIRKLVADLRAGAR